MNGQQRNHFAFHPGFQLLTLWFLEYSSSLRAGYKRLPSYLANAIAKRSFELKHQLPGFSIMVSDYRAGILLCLSLALASVVAQTRGVGTRQ